MNRLKKVCLRRAVRGNLHLYLEEHGHFLGRELGKVDLGKAKSTDKGNTL